jgi:hypothetical protein
MKEDELTQDSGEIVPQFSWAESLADETGMLYVLHDKSRKESELLWGYIVEYESGFIHLLNEETTGQPPLFHSDLDVASARRAIEQAYISSLANSTSHDVMHDADDERAFHRE